MQPAGQGMQVNAFQGSADPAVERLRLALFRGMWREGGWRRTGAEVELRGSAETAQGHGERARRPVCGHRGDLDFFKNQFGIEPGRTNFELALMDLNF